MLWGQRSRVIFPPCGLHKGCSLFPLTDPMRPPPHPVQACLVTRKREIEPKLQTLILHGVCIQEFREAAGGKVKELWEQDECLALST